MEKVQFTFIIGEVDSGVDIKPWPGIQAWVLSVFAKSLSPAEAVKGMLQLVRKGGQSLNGRWLIRSLQVHLQDGLLLVSSHADDQLTLIATHLLRQ
jgi:hypothetical protein